MFSDVDEHTACENPFTGNDRFVVYEDGGRPLDIQLHSGWKPSCAVVKHIARQLVEVLGYLFSKKVVHRKLEPGSVVFDPATRQVKLISLGEAKYIEPLDYEKKVRDFETQWMGVSSELGSKRRAQTRGSPPPAPHPNLSLSASGVYVHPSLR
jgi:serine/threonine protein kinase